MDATTSEVVEDEVVAGEGEEMMMDVDKVLISKERAMSLIKEGVTLGGGDDDRGDILMTQIFSIDTLLGDIYELKY